MVGAGRAVNMDDPTVVWGALQRLVPCLGETGIHVHHVVASADCIDSGWLT
jgi:hypothetical protein